MGERTQKIWYYQLLTSDSRSKCPHWKATAPSLALFSRASFRTPAPKKHVYPSLQEEMGSNTSPALKYTERPPISMIFFSFWLVLFLRLNSLYILSLWSRMHYLFLPSVNNFSRLFPFDMNIILLLLHVTETYFILS